MRSQAHALATLLVVSSSFLGGCGRTPDPETISARASVTSSPAKEAQQIFAERCSPCHGERGKGDGPAARECSPRPADLSDGARLSLLSDDELRALILRGGRATGRSNAMPPNSDLKERRETLGALVAIVRDLAPR